MVAGRELFAAQVRARLIRQGFAPDSADNTVHRLCQDGAVDNRRAAAAYARHAAEIKSRGRRRTLRELGELGVDTNDAKSAVDAAYAGLSDTALLGRVLSRRLAGQIETRAQFRRLYGALLRQGFEGSAVVAALKARTSSTVRADDE